jgi:hypothetical protein
MFNLDAQPGRFDVFLEAARRRHGEKAEIFTKIFAFSPRLRPPL